jgi:hypothetical protein
MGGTAFGEAGSYGPRAAAPGATLPRLSRKTLPWGLGPPVTLNESRFESRLLLEAGFAPGPSPRHASCNRLAGVLTRTFALTTWNRLGRRVRAGEKGIGIFAPVVYKVKTRDDGPQEGDDQAAQRIRGFRGVAVFDVSQTEGQPLPEGPVVTGDAGDYVGRLIALVERNEIRLTYSPFLLTALGVSTGGGIILRAGLSPAETLSVLTHEFAHELLHRDGSRDNIGQTVRETEAEAVAFVVGEAIGLQVGSTSADYIRLYRGIRPVDGSKGFRFRFAI